MQGQTAINFDFDKAADSYDDWYESVVGAMYDRLEKGAFDKLLKGNNYGKQLLEIGCGTGHWSEYFSGKGFDVTGVDISEKMIKKADEKNIPNCRFQIADGQKLGFSDNSFDIAAAVTTLEFAEEPEKMISEMRRCVKPGGKLLFGVLNSLSSYNRKRREKTESIYASAKLFSPGQLEDLLGRFGKVRIITAGFVPQNRNLVWSAPLCEFLCRLAGSRKGAFTAAEVQL